MAAMTNGPGLLVFPTTLKEGGLAVAEGGPLLLCIETEATSERLTVSWELNTSMQSNRFTRRLWESNF